MELTGSWKKKQPDGSAPNVEGLSPVITVYAIIAVSISYVKRNANTAGKNNEEKSAGTIELFEKHLTLW